MEFFAKIVIFLKKTLRIERIFLFLHKESEMLTLADNNREQNNNKNNY